MGGLWLVHPHPSSIRHHRITNLIYGVPTTFSCIANPSVIRFVQSTDRTCRSITECDNTRLLCTNLIARSRYVARSRYSRTWGHETVHGDARRSSHPSGSFWPLRLRPRVFARRGVTGKVYGLYKKARDGPGSMVFMSTFFVSRPLPLKPFSRRLRLATPKKVATTMSSKMSPTAIDVSTTPKTNTTNATPADDVSSATLPKLSAADFQLYNRLATTMDSYVSFLSCLDPRPRPRPRLTPSFTSTIDTDGHGTNYMAW